MEPIETASPALSRPARNNRVWFWIGVAGVSAFGAFLALGLVATLVVPNVLQKFARGSTEKAKVDLTSIESALQEYAALNGGKFPDSLRSLVTPDVNGYTYLKSTVIPRDPWFRDYRYDPPGPGRLQPRVYSYGRDGTPGGVGEDADLDNHSLSAGP